MDNLIISLLGVIQGATEFLPISSSAHLVITQALLQVQSAGLLTEVVLHLGTLVSVVIYFRRDLWRLISGFFRAGSEGSVSRLEVGYLALATLPAVAAALAFGDLIEVAFNRVDFTGWMLLVTTLVLVSTRWTVGKKGAKLTWAFALVIGAAQAMALLPGISRSGITIAAGLWLGLGRETSARFAFLMAVPAIIGAGMLKLLELAVEGTQIVPGLLIGFLVATVVGYSVIAWLMSIIRQGKLHFFAGYTLIIGLGVIFWL